MCGGCPHSLKIIGGTGTEEKKALRNCRPGERRLRLPRVMALRKCWAHFQTVAGRKNNAKRKESSSRGSKRDGGYPGVYQKVFASRACVARNSNPGKPFETGRNNQKQRKKT